MKTSNNSVTVLSSYLKDEVLTGSVPEAQYSKLGTLLVDAWDQFSGSDGQKTCASKIWRAEDIVWADPILSFKIERHPGTTNGSTRAVMHVWSVNIDTGKAAIVQSLRRQLYPMDKPLKVKPLAAETCKKIVAKETHETLKWIDDFNVMIQIGKIIPETCAETTAARRKRYRAALDKEMTAAGWKAAYRGTRCAYCLPNVSPVMSQEVML